MFIGEILLVLTLGLQTVPDAPVSSTSASIPTDADIQAMQSWRIPRTLRSLEVLRSEALREKDSLLRATSTWETMRSSLESSSLPEIGYVVDPFDLDWDGLVRDCESAETTMEADRARSRLDYFTGSLSRVQVPTNFPGYFDDGLYDGRLMNEIEALAGRVKSATSDKWSTNLHQWRAQLRALSQPAAPARPDPAASGGTAEPIVTVEPPELEPGVREIRELAQRARALDFSMDKVAAAFSEVARLVRAQWLAEVNGKLALLKPQLVVLDTKLDAIEHASQKLDARLADVTNKFEWIRIGTPLLLVLSLLGGTYVLFRQVTRLGGGEALARELVQSNVIIEVISLVLILSTVLILALNNLLGDKDTTMFTLIGTLAGYVLGRGRSRQESAGPPPAPRPAPVPAQHAPLPAGGGIAPAPAAPVP